VKGTHICNFPTDGAEFSTGEIMGHQNFNFTQSRVFPAPYVVFLKNISGQDSLLAGRNLGVGHLP